MSLHMQVHTMSSIKEWPNRQPTCPCTSSVGGVSAQCECSSPPCLCHVFILKWWCGGPLLVLGQGPCACGPIIPSLTQPVLGADGRLALKQGAHPPVFLPLSDPEMPLTSMHSLLLMDRRWSVVTSLVCVESARDGVHVLWSCCFIKGSVVYLMRTDERCDLHRAVPSAATYNTFFLKPICTVNTAAARLIFMI